MRRLCGVISGNEREVLLVNGVQCSFRHDRKVLLVNGFLGFVRCSFPAASVLKRLWVIANGRVRRRFWTVRDARAVGRTAVAEHRLCQRDCDDDEVHQTGEGLDAADLHGLQSLEAWENDGN